MSLSLMPSPRPHAKVKRRTASPCLLPQTLARQDKGARRSDRDCCLKVKPSAFLCITYTKRRLRDAAPLVQRLGGWCVADDATHPPNWKSSAGGADLARARCLRKLRNTGGLKIQTITRSANACSFPIEADVPPGFEIADEARSAVLLADARAEAALSEDGPRDAFRRFAKRLYSDHLEGLLDRLAMRRAEFHRFAKMHSGELFAAQALRERHGVNIRLKITRTFLARWRWNELRNAAVKLAKAAPTIARLVSVYAKCSSVLIEKIIHLRCRRVSRSR